MTDPKPQGATAVPPIVNSLRDRARQLRTTAKQYSWAGWAVLTVLFVFLIYSGTVFLQSGSLQDQVIQKRIAEMDAAVTPVLTSSKSIAAHTAQLQTAISQAVIPKDQAGAPGAIREADFQQVRREIAGIYNASVLAEDSLNRLRSFMKDGLPAAVSIPAEESHNLLITTVIIRLGTSAAAILLYFFFPPTATIFVFPTSMMRAPMPSKSSDYHLARSRVSSP